MELAESSLTRALKDSLIASNAAIPAGTTFGDLLAALRELGVTEADPIDSIEFGISQFGRGYVTVFRTDDGIEIREI